MQTMQVGELNTYDVLRNDWIVFTDAPCRAGSVTSRRTSSAETSRSRRSCRGSHHRSSGADRRAQARPTRPKPTPKPNPTQTPKQKTRQKLRPTCDAVADAVAEAETDDADAETRRDWRPRDRRRRGDRRHEARRARPPATGRSEKSYALMDDGVYVFVVANDASKTEIRSAVEQIFGVKV